MGLTLIENCLNSISRARKYSHLNAFITQTFDLGLEQAKKAHERQKTKSLRSKLDGYLFTIKDNFCTESIRTTCGSKMLENFNPSYNSTVVDKLYQSGAILLGKTNMDEFGMGSISSSYFGIVKNPHKIDQFNNHDDFFISGGSSGGSAVSVALDLCDFSIGSDTGGSVRQPAALCGCIGFKPTYGLISRYGLIPLNNYFDTVGIITKSITTLVDVLNTIAGSDLKDSTSTQKDFKTVELDANFSVSRLKFGIPKEFYPNGLSESNLNGWIKSLDLLSRKGDCKLQEVSVPNAPYSMSCYSVLTSCEVASNFARYDGFKYGYHSQIDLSKPNEYNFENLITKNRNESLGRVVKGRIVCGNYFLLENNYYKYFMKSLDMKELIEKDFLKVFDKVDILVTPTCFNCTPTIKEFLTNEQIFDEKDFFTACVNIAGLPALTIPVCLSSKGLPVGIQLISSHHNEALLLNIANWFVKNNKNYDLMNKIFF